MNFDEWFKTMKVGSGPYYWTSMYYIAKRAWQGGIESTGLWKDSKNPPTKSGNYLVYDGFSEPFIANYSSSFKKWWAHRTKNGKHSMYEMPSSCEIEIVLWIELPTVPERQNPAAEDQHGT